MPSQALRCSRAAHASHKHTARDSCCALEGNSLVMQIQRRNESKQRLCPLEKGLARRWSMLFERPWHRPRRIRRPLRNCPCFLGFILAKAFTRGRRTTTASAAAPSADPCFFIARDFAETISFCTPRFCPLAREGTALPCETDGFVDSRDAGPPAIAVFQLPALTSAPYTKHTSCQCQTSKLAIPNAVPHAAHGRNL